MDHAYFRRFAGRCRDLALLARNVAAKEQLYLWAEEFEARAAAAGDHENLTIRVDETAPAMKTSQRRDGGENAAR